MPGEMADDAWESGFEEERDRLALMLALSSECPKPIKEACHSHLAEWNDNGLYECPCGRAVDL